MADIDSYRSAIVLELEDAEKLAQQILTMIDRRRKRDAERAKERERERVKEDESES